MKKKFFIATCILFIIIQSATAQNNVYSLRQCVELALNNNITVKQEGLKVETAEVGLKQAKANLLPDLNGDFSYGFNKGRNVDPITNSYINQELTSSGVNLSSGIIIFNGLRLQNLIKQNKYTHEASKMDWQQIKDNFTLNVILAYLQVLSNEDMLDIAKGRLEVSSKQVERMEVLVKEGSAGNYQLTDLKGQQADESISIITRENQLKQSKLDLSRLMNIDYDPDMKLDRSSIETGDIISLYPTSSADVFKSALENLALVKANDLKIKSAERAVNVAKGNYYPSLSFYANLGSSYSSLAEKLNATNITEVSTGEYVIINGNQNPVLKQQQNYSSEKVRYFNQLSNNRGTFAGITMQIPLFNNFVVRNQVKLAKINLKNSEFTSENINLELKRDIEETWLSMDASFNRYKALLGQELNYQESFRAAEIRFNTGVINAYEYLIAKNNLDQARINLAQMKYDYIFRTKLLDFYSGKQLW